MNNIFINICIISLFFGFVLAEFNYNRTDFTYSKSNCSDFVTCEQCTKSWECNWCEAEKKCIKGIKYD